MAKFWVGNGGSWNDTAHWATSSGGAGGTGVPGAADNVSFDANSFTTTGQTVLVTASVTNQCNNMTWTGVLHSPVLSFPGIGTSSISVNGSMTLDSGMSITTAVDGNEIDLLSASSGQTITTSGVLFPVNLLVKTVGGVYTLQDSLTFSSNGGLSVAHATLDTNGKAVSMGSNLNLNSGTLTLGASVVTLSISGSQSAGLFLSGGTCNANTSKIVFTNLGSGVCTLHNSISASLHDLTITGRAEIYFNDFSLNTVTVNAGANVSFPDGDILTITSLVAQGTAGNHITFQSLDPGFQYTLSGVSTTLSYIDVQDSIATGTTPFVDTGGTNNGNNSGWTFPAAPAVVSAGASVFFHLL